MEKPPTFDMDLDDWELLPQDGLDKSISSKASPPLYPRCTMGTDCLDPSRILLDYIVDPRKTTVPDERIIMEINEPKADPTPPTSTPVFLDTIKDCGLVKEDTSLQWNERGENNDEDAVDMEEEKCLNSGYKRKGYWDGIGISVWGWRITGIGTLCTLGVAAATLCIFIIGGRNRQKPQHEKIQFQIYTDDKNLKQVVQHATRLNQAISATRGATMTRANISFGGTYAAP